MKSYARRVVFRPYRKGMGPTFTLTIWDDCVPSYDSAGRIRLRYRLTETRYWQLSSRKVCTTLFDCAPGAEVCVHAASDSDAAVKAVMGWLTLKPGDTDAEYFKDYTSDQLAFCSAHAEALQMAVIDRFGEDS